MAENPRGVAAMKSSHQQFSSMVERSLAQAAKSLSGRPQELRGPFVVKAASSTSSAAATKKK
jgi:hypothetical protein